MTYTPRSHQDIPEGYYTVAEAARLLGITHRAADERIRKGYLGTEVIEVPTRLIPKQAIETSNSQTPHCGRKS